MIKRLGENVTVLMKKVEKMEAILKDVAKLYRFEDQKVFSLNDVSFIIDFVACILSMLEGIKKSILLLFISLGCLLHH